MQSPGSRHESGILLGPEPRRNAYDDTRIPPFLIHYQTSPHICMLGFSSNCIFRPGSQTFERAGNSKPFGAVVHLRSHVGDN